MRRITRFRKRTLVVLGVVAVIAAMASVGAYAYFTATGEGSGSATVGTSTDWDVDTAAEAGGPMYPGGGALTYVDVDYTVTNPSQGNQNLANVNIKIAESRRHSVGRRHMQRVRLRALSRWGHDVRGSRCCSR